MKMKNEMEEELILKFDVVIILEMKIEEFGLI